MNKIDSRNEKLIGIYHDNDDLEYSNTYKRNLFKLFRSRFLCHTADNIDYKVKMNILFHNTCTWNLIPFNHHYKINVN